MTLRYRVSFLGLILGFLLVTIRLFYWQVVKASELAQMGLDQYGQIQRIAPQRGEIDSSDGFPLATNKISYIVFANPKQVKDKLTVAQVLAPMIKEDEASISASLSLDKFWVPLKSFVDPDIKNKIEALNLSGIGFEQKYERFYPEASMAATLLGFVGKDNEGNDKGYFGLEGYYDRLLAGKPGSAIQINDATGKPILAKINGTSDEIDGGSITLSIDRPIQFLVEKKLKEGVEKYGAQSGMVGIIEPSTGKIIAMASYPNFDPANYEIYPSESYVNPFISNLYEPGSTFKPLVMSAALNDGLLTPQTKCPVCAGPVPVSGYQIHTWNDKYFPNTTMTDVIMHSDNTGMVFVAQKLGLDRMLDYLGKFGIGKLTGIDLQGESAPEIKPKDSWYAVDLATTGFGQGINVTPIELLTAFSSIANKGKMMQPYVVTGIKNAEGKTIDVNPKEIGQPISETTAKVMTEILVNAVNKGEASYARLKGYRIAGKTGTASIPIEGHYDPTKTIASFEGFAPADNPRFAMIVIFNRPTAAVYGAETAAPVFFDIAQNILNYYGITPSQ